MTQPAIPPDLHPSVKHLLSTYLLGRKLGGGSFGTVREAQHILTKQRVAIKIISRQRMTEEAGAEDKVRREIAIMRLLSHPHIVRLYEVIETPRDIYLVMEFVAAGELFDFLNVRGRLHEPGARRLFQQLICGIEACHAAGVVHRDLKPENLLLTADGDSERAALKIADFGLSNVMRDGHFLATSCGSPNYAAPEVIAGRLYAGPEVDIWSAGCILFALLAGRLPFDDGNVGRLFRAIKAGAFVMPTHLSASSRDLLRRMLTVDPLKRITIPEIRQHPWFAERLPDYLATPLPALELHGLPPLPNTAILTALASAGIDPQAAARAVQRREHTPSAVAYHLLYDAAQRRVQPNGAQAASPTLLESTASCAPLAAAAQQRVGSGLWLCGLMLRPAGGPGVAAAALVAALGAQGCAWKRVALYTYRCRSLAVTTQTGRWRAKAAQQQLSSDGAAHERHTIKFQVHMYTVAEATYLVDVQRLHGNLAQYLDLCAALLSRVATAAAAHNVKVAAAPQQLPPPHHQPQPNGHPPLQQPQQLHGRPPQQQQPPQPNGQPAANGHHQHQQPAMNGHHPQQPQPGMNGHGLPNGLPNGVPHQSHSGIPGVHGSGGHPAMNGYGSHVYAAASSAMSLGA